MTLCQKMVPINLVQMHFGPDLSVGPGILAGGAPAYKVDKNLGLNKYKMRLYSPFNCSDQIKSCDLFLAYNFFNGVCAVLLTT